MPSSFYDDENGTIELFEKFLHENMNYHAGDRRGPSDNIFKNTVLNFLPYIQNDKKFLDVGCGFGGPARTLVEVLPGVEVVGLTDSKLHADYLLSNPIPNFRVVHTKAEDWVSEEEFDVAMFIQTFSLMEDVVLERVNARKLIMSVYVAFDEDNMDEVYIPSWDMNVYSERKLREVLFDYGYEIKSLKYVSDDYWYWGCFIPWYPKLLSVPVDEMSDSVKVMFEQFCAFEAMADVKYEEAISTGKGPSFLRRGASDAIEPAAHLASIYIERIV